MPPVSLTDVPEAEWIHVVMDFNAGTDAWTTSVTYASGSGGGTFAGTNTNNILVSSSTEAGHSRALWTATLHRQEASTPTRPISTILNVDHGRP